MLKKTIHIIRKEGILPLFREAIIRITGQKPLMEFDELKHYFCGKRGLEIGGPSRIFAGRSLLPIYSLVASCDNCNFSHNTVWQGNVKEGMTFRYHSKKPAGYQFIRDACNLTGIDSESYDFVISSHLINKFKEQGKTILLVTHDLGTVQNWCHQAILLNQGELQAFGDAKEVVALYRDKIL